MAVFGVGFGVFEQLAELLAGQRAVLFDELGAGDDLVDRAGQPIGVEQRDIATHGRSVAVKAVSDDHAQVVQSSQQQALLGGVADGFVFVALFADLFEPRPVKQVLVFRQRGDSFLDAQIGPREGIVDMFEPGVRSERLRDQLAQGLDRGGGFVALVTRRADETDDAVLFLDAFLGEPRAAAVAVAFIDDHDNRRVVGAVADDAQPVVDREIVLEACVEHQQIEAAPGEEILVRAAHDDLTAKVPDIEGDASGLVRRPGLGVDILSDRRAAGGVFAVAPRQAVDEVANQRRFPGALVADEQQLGFVEGLEGVLFVALAEAAVGGEDRLGVAGVESLGGKNGAEVAVMPQIEGGAPGRCWALTPSLKNGPRPFGSDAVVADVEGGELREPRQLPRPFVSDAVVADVEGGELREPRQLPRPFGSDAVESDVEGSEIREPCQTTRPFGPDAVAADFEGGEIREPRQLPRPFGSDAVAADVEGGEIREPRQLPRPFGSDAVAADVEGGEIREPRQLPRPFGSDAVGRTSREVRFESPASSRAPSAPMLLARTSREVRFESPASSRAPSAPMLLARTSREVRFESPASSRAPSAPMLLPPTSREVRFESPARSRAPSAPMTKPMTASDSNPSRVARASGALSGRWSRT